MMAQKKAIRKSTRERPGEVNLDTFARTSRPALIDACHRYVNRFTMDHTPPWAMKPFKDGKWPAPQYRSDLEWYANTIFPGEAGLHRNSHHCQSSNQTWPLGQTLSCCLTWEVCRAYKELYTSSRDEQ
jgi:hypothetical protein